MALASTANATLADAEIISLNRKTRWSLTYGSAGAPGKIRTCDTFFRREVLFP